MNQCELKQLAASLPTKPGVYLMMDKNSKVIYVGKAKRLRDRVGQYFLDSVAHTPKTRLMVSKIHHFDVIIAASEFEALVLENSLIKRHMPKYNILLKDDKGYPFLRLDMRQEYPVLSMVSKPADDGAEYFGPYGSRSATQDLLDSIRVTLKLPGCTKKFPRDIGKTRPCLNYHMNQCLGWCQAGVASENYRQLAEQVRQLLRGNYKQIVSELRNQMLDASDQLNFELAANLRDRINAFDNLAKKQLVTAGKIADTDVIGFSLTGTSACFMILHFSAGNLIDKDFEILSSVEDDSALESIILQYYLNRGYSPRRILLPRHLQDQQIVQEVINKDCNSKTSFIVPQRGDNVRLIELAASNATEELQRNISKEEHLAGSLYTLGKMLGINAARRIESFDISNISGTDIVAGMTVFIDGKPKRSDYRKFKIKDLTQQDDYASMSQAVLRRFQHYLSGDPGFESLPDLLLIDGGVEHAATVESTLQTLQIAVPVFGMVKDDRHRTRALVTSGGHVIEIITQPAVFALIGSIQEHTHNYAIGYHRKLRSNRMRYSQLDTIDGIGPVRKQILLKQFKSINGIKAATLEELERVLPKDAALAVFKHFSQNTDQEV